MRRFRSRCRASCTTSFYNARKKYHHANHSRDDTFYRPCRAFAEIEVLFPKHANQSADDVSTVCMPDLAVICNPNKLHEQYCFGAPTVVMEILSPSTAKADRLVKLNRYQQAGVPEYWIVSPQEQNATVFVLENGLYRTVAVYTKEDTAAKVFTLIGCELDLMHVFE